jgi:hypothetical protein
MFTRMFIRMFTHMFTHMFQACQQFLFTHIATTQNNLKQHLLGWLYYR